MIAGQVYEPPRRGSGGSFVVKKALRDRLPADARLKAGVVVEIAVSCLGIFFTFFTGFGLDLPWVIALATRCTSRLDIAEVLKSSEAHKQHFEEFRVWLLDLVARFKMYTWGCSMEVGQSGSANHPCAVHLHGWMTSASPVEGAWLDSPLKVVLKKSELKFGDHDATFLNVVPWRRSGPKSVMLAQRGLYYILCRKLGSVFSAGSHRPFEDRLDFKLA